MRGDDAVKGTSSVDSQRPNPESGKLLIVLYSTSYLKDNVRRLGMLALALLVAVLSARGEEADDAKVL